MIRVFVTVLTSFLIAAHIKAQPNCSIDSINIVRGFEVEVMKLNMTKPKNLLLATTTYYKTKSFFQAANTYNYLFDEKKISDFSIRLCYFERLSNLDTVTSSDIDRVNNLYEELNRSLFSTSLSGSEDWFYQQVEANARVPVSLEIVYSDNAKKKDEIFYLLDFEGCDLIKCYLDSCKFCGVNIEGSLKRAAKGVWFSGIVKTQPISKGTHALFIVRDGIVIDCQKETILSNAHKIQVKIMQ